MSWKRERRGGHARRAGEAEMSPAAEVQKRYSDTIERAIARAEQMDGRVTVKAWDGSEAYAHPHSRGIAWGVNEAATGVNILRGIRRPDGADEAVS
jgi:hypothetical protein